MLTTKTHVDMFEVPSICNDQEVYDALFQGREPGCAVPFDVDTQYDYHTDEEWMRQVSKELIVIGAKQGATIYIDN